MLFLGVTAKRFWGPEGVQLYTPLCGPSHAVYFDERRACWVVQFRPAVSLVSSQIHAFEQYAEKLARALAVVDMPGLDHVYGEVSFHTSIRRIASPSYAAAHLEKVIHDCCKSIGRKD